MKFFTDQEPPPSTHFHVGRSAIWCSLIFSAGVSAGPADRDQISPVSAPPNPHPGYPQCPDAWTPSPRDASPTARQRQAKGPGNAEFQDVAPKPSQHKPPPRHPEHGYQGRDGVHQPPPATFHHPRTTTQGTAQPRQWRTPASRRGRKVAATHGGKWMATVLAREGNNTDGGQAHC